MILKSVIVLLATSALATKLIQHLSQKHQSRPLRDDHKRHHDDVHRWEAEGGNLPVKPER